MSVLEVEEVTHGHAGVLRVWEVIAVEAAGLNHFYSDTGLVAGL